MPSGPIARQRLLDPECGRETREGRREEERESRGEQRGEQRGGERERTERESS